MINKSIAFLAALFIALTAAAQNRVSVTQNQFALKGDSVYVELTVGLNNAQVAKRAFVLLTPTIAQGSVSMELPPIMINGKNRHKAYRRLEALHREPVGVGQVINAGAKNGPRTYRYSTVFVYEPWMEQAVFTMREDQCECNGPLVPMDFDFNGGVMQNLNPPVAPPVKIVEVNYAVSFKEPNPEPVKTRSESGKAYLDFAAGRSELKPEFKDNAAELAKIGGLIQRIKDDPYTDITQIVIDGYASPEGTYANNMTLSAGRARALKEYVKAAYGLKENLFRVNGRGEDWAGLEELVMASGKYYTDDALAIIRGTDIFDGREKRLMDLHGGAPYKDMLAEMFPLLRRSDYELKYTVIPFTVEQGRRTIRTNPSLMSLNEMFLVAESYPAGSQQYNEVFGIAARVYPDSDIANLNAAANALAVGDQNAAEDYLARVALHDSAWSNNMGVAAAMRGDFRTAAAHFESARAAGSAEAVKNLAELDKFKDIP